MKGATLRLVGIEDTAEETGYWGGVGERLDGLGVIWLLKEMKFLDEWHNVTNHVDGAV